MKNNLQSVSSVNVFPNPSQGGGFNFQLGFEEMAANKIIVCNLLGKKVFEKRLALNDKTWSVDLHEHGKGTYVYQLYFTNGKITS